MACLARGRPLSISSSKANDRLLQKAGRNKRDEFYTQYGDSQRELTHYKDHFRGKVVYCSTDDPRVSYFVK